MTAANLPQWKCHKVVRAAKIAAIAQGETVQDQFPNGSWLLKLDGVEEPREVAHEWKQKHTPEVGGYYVVYEDGYTSFSPAEAFEAGYKRLPDGLDKLPGHQSRVVMEEAELAARYERLSAFINGEVFNGLTLDERGELAVQALAMSGYLGALRSRIARFKA